MCVCMCVCVCVCVCVSLAKQPLPHGQAWCNCVTLVVAKELLHNVCMAVDVLLRNVFVVRYTVTFSCKPLAAILHLIRWSTYLIGHAGILAWTQLVVRNCTRSSVEEGLASKAMCGKVFDSGLTIQSMSSCLSHRVKTFLSIPNLTSHLPSIPIAYLNICASCSSVTVTLTLGVL